MKLYINQKVFSAVPRFFVKDEYGNDRYEIRGKMGLSVGLQLYVYDMKGRELAHISQKALSFQPTFRVLIDGVQKATVMKKFTFMKPKYEVPELEWVVQGDFSAHEYTISNKIGPVMTIHKEWFSWGDTFVLDMASSENELEALAVVLAIDCVVDSSNKDHTLDFDH